MNDNKDAITRKANDALCTYEYTTWPENGAACKTHKRTVRDLIVSLIYDKVKTIRLTCIPKDIADVLLAKALIHYITMAEKTEVAIVSMSSQHIARLYYLLLFFVEQSGLQPQTIKSVSQQLKLTNGDSSISLYEPKDLVGFYLDPDLVVTTSDLVDEILYDMSYKGEGIKCVIFDSENGHIVTSENYTFKEK